MNTFKEQRIKAGYKTQKELADVLFVNQTAVSQWERGVTIPSPPILMKLSQMYGVSTDYLLGNDSVQKEKPTAEGDELTKDEETVIQLLRQVPEDRRDLVVNMIEAALKSQGLLD